MLACPRTACAALISLLLTLSARPLAAQGGFGPQVTVTPASQTFHSNTSTYTVAVAVQFCDNNSNFDWSTLSLTLDGSDVSGSLSVGGVWQGPTCVYQRRYYGNIVLPQTNDGVHSFHASVEDLNGWFGSGWANYTISGRAMCRLDTVFG